MADKQEKPKPKPIRVINGDKQERNFFIQVPRFWTDVLMQPYCWYENGSKAPRIPNSFWKYMLYLWRYITDGNELRECEIASKQFPVRTDAAVRWTAAVSLSGLFDVTFGKWTKQHDEPTHFAYRCDATQQDWEAFVHALDFTLNQFKEKAKIPHEPFDQWANNGGFKVMLAINVDSIRASRGLPPVNQQFLKNAVEGLIRDGWKRQIAKMVDGKVVPLFYGKIRRKRAGETEDEYETRLYDEALRD